MQSTESIMGFIFGLIAVLVIFVVIRKVTGTTSRQDYDERQELIRGRGYKYAVITLMVLLLAHVILVELVPHLPVSPALIDFTILMAGIVVYAVYCILHDAYFGIHQQPRRYMILLAAVILCNLLPIVMSLSSGAYRADPALFASLYSNVLMVVSFGIVLLAIQVRRSQLRKEDADEES